MKNKWILALFVILFLCGGLLRTYKLDQYPPQLNRDEAALAINALYIQESGVDEWSIRYPLQFKSFGDYKLPGYIYLLSLLFNLQVSDFIVRIPAAVAGMFLSVITAFWAMYLLKIEKNKVFFFFILLSITVSPFAVFYSRMAWEANVALAFMMTALLLWYSPKSSIQRDISGVLLYIISVLTYNSPLLLLPFFIPTIVVIRGMKNPRQWLFPVIAMSCLCVFFFIIFAQNNAQKAGIIFMNDAQVISEYPSYRMEYSGIVQKILGNKFIYFIRIASDNFFQTYLPSFLVTHGGQHPWHSILGRGHVYWVTYCLFIFGFGVQLFRFYKKIFRFGKKFNWSDVIHTGLPLYLLIISSMPAIFTTDAPHATRSLFTLVLIVIFSGIGFEVLVRKVQLSPKKQFKSVLIGFFVCIFSLESSHYFYQYFYEWPPIFSPDFKVQYKEQLIKTSQDIPEGEIGVLDSGIYLYVLTAWYMRIPSSDFLSTVKREGPDTVGLYYVSRLGRYHFFPTIQQQPKDIETIIKLD